MQNSVLSRKQVALPSLESLGAELSLEMARISAGLDDLTSVPPLLVRRGPDDLFAPLRHPLSAHFVALNGPPEAATRSEAECDALNWFESRPPLLREANQACFLQAMEDLNRRLTGVRGGWRTGGISTAQDLQGNRIRFPPHSCVRPQMEQLRRLLRHGVVDRPAVFTATMALVLLTNCHPFRDGNGRVARVLFNHILRTGGMRAGVYVPVYELVARSEGGYLIAVRQGELRGDWEPLLKFVMNMLGVHVALARWEQRISDV